MLNNLNTLIGFEIEVKIKVPTIYSQNVLSNYFILLLMATALNVSVPQPSPWESFDNRTMYETAMYS